MHAALHGSRQALSGTPIRGTFFPGDGPMTTRGSTASSLLPKLIAILVAISVARAVAAARRHGGPGRSGRRAAIARLHRELHAQDAAEAGRADDEAVPA